MKEERLKRTLANVNNNDITNKVHDDVQQFKEEILEKYDIKLYVAIPKINFSLKPIISLSDLWHLILEMLEEDHPHLLQYANFKNKTRIREWMIYNHSFSYLACRELGYGPTQISLFLNKTHASIINSVNKAEFAIETKEKDFMPIHNKLFNKLQKYVGTICEDSKI